MHFNSELCWSVQNAMWVLGAKDPIYVFRELRRYSLKETVGMIRQPTLILHGEKDHFIPREQADMLYSGLKAPKTRRVFTQEDSAEEHCQMGNLIVIHQVLFDWLDKTM